jgi:predicted nucleic acid-binding protein
VAGELLLDTSALVGLLDRSQSVHKASVDFFSTWRGAVVTTEAVLTESIYLLSGARNGGPACIDFILEGGIVLVPPAETSLSRCRALLEKYADLPIDFADATLIVLAEELNTDLVFTFDRDFQIYRIRGRKPFRVAPAVNLR